MTGGDVRALPGRSWGGRGGTRRRAGQRAQGLQLGEAVEAGWKQSGVDGAGDGGARRDGGDHRDAEDLTDISGRQAAAWLSHEDHAVGSRPGISDQAGQGQVARPPHDGVAHPSVGLPGDGARGAGVDHYNLVVGGRDGSEPQ